MERAFTSSHSVEASALNVRRRGEFEGELISLSNHPYVKVFCAF